jgi:23S rRNA pseudouridine2605 synthase
VRLPQPLLRGQSQELPQADVDALRKAVGLEDGTPSALTLMPVLGQRKASKTVVTGNARGHGYVGGHSTADEGRELRRFDQFREDRGRRGGKRPTGGLTVSGEMAAKQADKRMKIKGPHQPGQRMRPGEQRGEGNPAAMRTWYVPNGVDTGPSGHRNPDGARGPRKPYGSKPAGSRPPGARGPGGPRPASSPYGESRGPRPQGERGPGGAGERGPRREAGAYSDAPRSAKPYGGFAGDSRGPRREGGFNAGENRPQRAPKPYGHPGNAPSFPSDHANPGGFNPYADRPRGPRPGGPRPAGGRPGNGPRGPRPAGGNPGGGHRGPRGGNR